MWPTGVAVEAWARGTERTAAPAAGGWRCATTKVRRRRVIAAGLLRRGLWSSHWLVAGLSV